METQHFVDPVQIVDASRETRTEVGGGHIPIQVEVSLHERFRQLSDDQLGERTRLYRIGRRPLIEDRIVAVSSNEREARPPRAPKSQGCC